MQNDHEILIAGTGNVAFSIASALKSQGIEFVFGGRNTERLNQLKEAFGVSCYSLQQINFRSTLTIICVNDDSIEEVVSQLAGKSKFICHTSGSRSIDILSHHPGGIFYPFQTFSGNRITSFEGIPVFIESNNKEAEQYLIELGHLIKANVKELNSEVRKVLHLAGVLTNNFSTLLIQEAKTLLQAENISLEVLRPILQETFEKALIHSLEDSLTGPAKRGDLKTIETHQLFLAKNPSLKKVYDSISAHILSHYHKGK